MNWYSGNIAEAVQKSKTNKSIFVVYISGTDDLSKKLTSFLDDSRISKYLESDDFVAIKINSGSEEYIQFAQIYQLVPLPSIFFIGKNGTPMEVITGITASVDELEQKVKNVLERSGKEKRDESLLSPSSNPTTSTFPTTSIAKPATTPSNASANFISSEQSQTTSTSSSASDPNIECKDGVCYRKPAEEKLTEEKKPSEEIKPAEETKPTEDKQPVEEKKPVEEKQPSTEEKLERAKELIEQKRKEKEEADAETEREREVRRRKEGQEVLNLKKWQEEQEIKQLKDDRKREKLEEQAVRKRILEQIEQDKAERAQRFGHIVNPPNANDSVPGTSTSTTKPTTPKSENSEFARIQFKKPGGDTEMHIFNSQDVFQVLRNYVLNNILVGTGIRDFSLATTFPRREFTEVENDQKLIDLGLSPTAVLLILPKFKSVSNQNTVVAATRGIYDIASAVIWNIFTPVLAVFGYIRNLIFARKDAEIGAQKRASEESLSDNDAAKRRNISGNKDEQKPSTSNDKSGAYKRVGSSNIHRLHDSRDSDEENNTWNGNSTQQQ